MNSHHDVSRLPKLLRVLTLLAAACLTLAGCAAPPASTQQPAATETPAPASADKTLNAVNRVWKVSASPDIQVGQLYAFLSEGTLVVAAGNGTPSFGKWSAKDGGLEMVEEGIAYAVDIVALSPSELRIRIHNPGKPTEITLVPAEEPFPSSVRVVE